MKLYTIPYAGGFSFTYLKWRKYLDKSIELCPVELPGRGRETNELLGHSISQMANYVYKQIDVNNGEYSLFGHSMGAYVLFELYSQLVAAGKPLPKHIIISGMKPPHLYAPKGYHLLDETSFRSKMFDMGGIPPLLADDKEFSKLLFDLLRNDLKAVEEYRISKLEPIISCEVSLFNSESDVSREDILQWNKYSQDKCTYYKFVGTHFFINDHVLDTVNVINQVLVKQFDFNTN